MIRAIRGDYFETIGKLQGIWRMKNPLVVSLAHVCVS